jgi:hypothetical protein
MSCDSRFLCGSVSLNSENTGAFLPTQSLIQIIASLVAMESIDN